VSDAESKNGDTQHLDRRPLAMDSVVERTGRVEIERVNAPELRTITPEEIQVLAATGC
jgi:hypothetical protein